MSFIALLMNALRERKEISKVKVGEEDAQRFEEIVRLVAKAESISLEKARVVVTEMIVIGQALSERAILKELDRRR
jgi:hypothetical protein